ncbi:MAG TPA: type 4a pilus biogenesis protein PilO [Caulifigura sp.]|jgi:Tfp pilus assembly protein PilO|nr:type 4a pilus biogenesis protein PilO [Caulifigura sp.]
MPSTDPSLIRTGRSLHAVGLGVMVLLAVVPYVAAGLPMSSQNAFLRRRIEKSTRLLELEPNVRVRNEQLNRELAVHEQRRREVLERIPEAADEGLFLAQLSELAAKSDLKLQNYRPGPPEKKSTYSQVDIALDADGTYEQLCQFLAGLESLPRYCRLAGLTVSRPEGEASTLKVSLTLRIFFGSTPDQPV